MRLSPLFAALAVASALFACAPARETDVSKAAFDPPLALPGNLPLRSFAPAQATGALRSNAEMAQDFLDLNFRMESGRTLPVLTRFEEPITVALSGDVPATARNDLTGLLARLRAEAGLDIRQTNAPAAITLDFQPKAALSRAVPSAACFVVPNVTGLADYRKKRGSAAVDWGQLPQRTRIAVMLPSDSSPQEVRDCLHEELAQALGPLNDLFRLPDSVFNDDNFHSVLTGFDMLMLRVHYAPDLRSGMTEAQVAARLPAILARLNPAGQNVAGGPKQISPRAFLSATQTAFGTGAGAGGRASGAARMLAIARAEGWTDGRLAFSHYAHGRALTARDSAAATEAYSQAAQIWRAQPGGQIHAAHVDMQLAAFALSSGQNDAVLFLTARAIPVARSHQNASLLSSLLAMRAEALTTLGRAAEARSARLDSLAWARYAFGSEAQVRARMSDIAALARRGGRG
ncbi:DUF2927 domain-containing protein [Pseudotabrizicola sediminis]|uniref:DUF2927 domain-containing protein n=1 Tax=Pseudotabrizicola sediminis TaxID=2486418 RepID=A0ABY2KRR9_9RHOB|nr:DUF2927 domain-containing protein [Pseudotabrizicola sediminis]TGD45381.1 DUF2927 domain-containing protein [Pseudotabrizicola sediminis]